MKTLKTILLITGILVAALALNTSFAQEIVRHQDKDKSMKVERKAVVRKEAKARQKEQKILVKSSRKPVPKPEVKARREEKKLKVREKSFED